MKVFGTKVLDICKKIKGENGMKLKKFCCRAAAVLLSCACLFTVACGKTQIGGGEEEGISTLYVNNYAGGFGKAWLDEIEKRFEEKYANTSFEPGKTGVNVRIDHNKDSGTSYLNKLENINSEIFFPERIDYHAWVKQGKILDISDTVKKENPDDGNKTILSKMSEAEKSYYQVDGKYYAIPHHEHQVGLIYDIDLFEEAELYFAKNGAPSEDYASDKAANGSYAGGSYKNAGAYADSKGYSFTGTGAKSAGPDGKHGTTDDGLPATYDEFYVLCDYMAELNWHKKIVPIIWSGKNRAEYMDWQLCALTADYEGEEQFKLNYTYSGTAKNLISVDNMGNVTPLDDVPISSQTGYKIYSSAGRYYALSFLDTIVENGNKWLDKDCFGSSEHIEVQYRYLLGATSEKSTSRYAFLADGCWWENEAEPRFSQIADEFGSSYSETERRFGFLPFPKATNDKIGESRTTMTTEVTMGFIKSSINPNKINLAKTFLAFCYEDAQLALFNTITGIPAALDYELSSEGLATLSEYGRSLYEARNLSVQPYSTNPIFLNNFTNLRMESTFKAGGMRAIEYLREGTAAEFFRQIVKGYTETSWTASYGSYWN